MCRHKSPDHISDLGMFKCNHALILSTSTLNSYSQCLIRSEDGLRKQIYVEGEYIYVGGRIRAYIYRTCLHGVFADAPMRHALSYNRRAFG
jgi:hypothetical protein